jgi:hypothetical protein
VPGPWSYSIGTLTVSGSSQQHTRIVGITPGAVQVSGQMQTSILSFQVGIPPTNVGGSIPQSSVQNVSGPGAVSISGVSCNIQYSQSGTTPTSFSFSFTLNAAGAASNASCRG